MAAVGSSYGCGRVYAGYGGVYVCMAMLWLWTIDGVRPSLTDWVGMSVSVLGMGIIMFGPKTV